MITQTARQQFQSHIRGFVKSGGDYGKPYGTTDGLIKVEFPTTLRVDGHLSLFFRPEIETAMQAIASVMLHHRYNIREWSSGSLSWRNIGGISRDRIDRQVREQKPYATSLHAHAVAVDINPSANPFSTSKATDFPPEMVADWKSIKTQSGRTPYRFGLDWSRPDTMHIEGTGLDSARAYLEDPVDLSTVVGWVAYTEWVNNSGELPPITEDEMAIKIGDSGFYVKEWQQALNKAHTENDIPGEQINDDGQYGSKTALSTTQYQTAAKLPQTGQIDWQTAEYLKKYHPRLGAAPAGSDDLAALANVVSKHIADVITDTPHT